MILLLVYIFSQCLFTYFMLNTDDDDELMGSMFVSVLSFILMPGSVIAAALYNDEEF